MNSPSQIPFFHAIYMQHSSTPEQTDWESLLHAARAGDDAALNEVWTQLRDYLLLTADDVGSDLNGKLDASDIVQQSLMEAHEEFSNFRGQSENEIRAWLVKLVQHNLIDAGRRFRQTKQRDIQREYSLDAKNGSQEIPGPDKTASSLMRLKERDEELMRAMALLPERSQQVLELRHRRGYSHTEVARELGMTEQATRKLWSRTVEELRNQLARRTGD